MDIKIRQSELSGWAGCRRKTVLQYREGYNRPPRDLSRPPSTANVGTIYHAGLQFHYETGGLAQAYVGAEAARLAEEYGDELSDKWKDAYNLAWTMCEGYEQWLEETGADAGFVVTGVERELEVFWGEIDGHRIYLVGHIDLEGIDALGRPVLMDHKSVQGLGLTEGGPKDFQRATYAMMRMIEDGTHYAALIHNEAKRTKRTARATPPFYGRTEVQFSVEALRKHYQQVSVLVQEIVAARTGGLPADAAEFYPRPNKDCSWSCPYYNACSMLDDGADWQWYLDQSFVKMDTHVPGTDADDE